MKKILKLLISYSKIPIFCPLPPPPVNFQEHSLPNRYCIANVYRFPPICISIEQSLPYIFHYKDLGESLPWALQAAGLWQEHPRATEMPFLCPRKFSSAFMEIKSVYKKCSYLSIVCIKRVSGNSPK